MTTTKRRVAITADKTLGANFAGMPAGVAVLAEKPGQLTLLDKAKGYYHALIAALSTILIFCNELMPAIPDANKPELNVVIATIGAIITAIKSNETWIQAD